ncbi:zf-HC2 domain-containing protein [bacterium]|nr:zf-HC2 domain-containing protein [bacterium]
MKNGKLNCEQVMALMSFYVENKLSEQLAKCVKEHLETCKECRDSYKNFQEMLGQYFGNSKEIANDVDIENSPYQTRQYDEFKKYVSEYFDNELDDEQNIRIKKIAITNPLARKDLEKMYSFKKLLHLSFEKTRNEMKEDYSKGVLMLLEHDKSFIGLDSFFKLAAAFLIIISAIVIGFYLVVL